MSTEDRKKKFEHILSLNTHESIVLQQLIENGSTTVRDLLPFMNYPCGPIRDLQSVFGVALVYDWETKEKTAVAASLLKRNFIGIENNKKYYELSLQRLEAEQAQRKLFEI